MGLFSTKKADPNKLTLGEWIFGKGEEELIDLYVLGQCMEDSDLLTVVIGEIYQRDNWLEIVNEAQDELFKNHLINKYQFMLLRIIDDFNKRTMETNVNSIAYSDKIGNLENLVRIMVGKYYDPKTMGEPFSNEEIQDIVEQIREANSG